MYRNFFAVLMVAQDTPACAMLNVALDRRRPRLRTNSDGESVDRASQAPSAKKKTRISLSLGRARWLHTPALFQSPDHARSS